MSKTFTFTEAKIRKLEPPGAGGRVYHKDAQLRGLQVCVTGSGGKTYYFVRRMDGRPTRMKLGTTDELSVEDARKAAEKIIGELAAGRNPHIERRSRRHETTLQQLFDHWLETHAKPRKRTWAEDERQYNAFLEPWASRRLSAIKKADVAALHARVGKENGPYAANRLLALIKAMYNKAPDLDYVGINPAVGVKKFPEVKRDRFLHADELRAFFVALDAEPDVTLRDFFTVLLLTGARRSNVQSMRWDEIDLAAGLWRIPGETAKAGVAIVVPLVGPVLRILEARRQVANGSPWVFSSHSKTGHLVEPKTAWKRIIDRAGLVDVRPHDLRRSLGSWMAMTGTGLPVIGKMLGHTQPNTTAIYARLAVDPVRQAAEKATTAMLEAGGVKLLEAKPEESR